MRTINRVYTENMDTAYESTGNANLDFFGAAGASRYNQEQVADLFLKALHEDAAMALRNLFHLRDVRGGKGERDSFRTCMGTFIEWYPEAAVRLLPLVVEYGRWDDTLVYLDSWQTATNAADFIKAQLEADLRNLEEGKGVSLCAKWMPSVNASSKWSRRYSARLAGSMGMTKAEYRKLLSRLRKGNIVERYLTERDYSFTYEKLPGRAMRKYQQAFYRNDGERFAKYLDELACGKLKAKSGTLYPYEIVEPFLPDYYFQALPPTQTALLRAEWRALKAPELAGNTIVVRDGSGSMWGRPLNVATALAILFAEHLTGPFRNKFITFSAYPEIVTLPEGEIDKKIEECAEYRDCTNTDIEAVYDLILEASLLATSPEDYIKRVIIISDMEFDMGTTNVPTFETTKEKYEAVGVPMPEMIYWNVNARGVHFAARADQPNVRFVSGFSQHVLDALDNEEELAKLAAAAEMEDMDEEEAATVDALAFMEETLRKYDEVVAVAFPE